jgi:hypothetical protein
MRTFDRKKDWIALGLVAFVGLGLLLACGSGRKDAKVKYVDASYAFDVSDPRELALFADNIFIGRVDTEIGTFNDGRMPNTHYRVEVLENVKGRLKGRVRVNQDGGFNEDENTVILMQGDQLLKAGDTYLLVTKGALRRNGNGKPKVLWHTLVPVYGDVPIANEAERVEIVEKFQRALRETGQPPLEQ